MSRASPIACNWNGIPLGASNPSSIDSGTNAAQLLCISVGMGFNLDDDDTLESLLGIGNLLPGLRRNTPDARKDGYLFTELPWTLRSRLVQLGPTQNHICQLCTTNSI